MRPLRSNTAVACLLLALPLGACVAPAERPDAAGAAQRAAGLLQPVAVRAPGAPLDAADPAGGHLTLAQAVRRAVAHDPRIAASAARADAAWAAANQARTLPNPLLDLTLRFPEGGGATIVETALTADLVALLGRPRRIDAADREVDAALLDVARAALDTVLEAREAYARCQELDALLPLLAAQRAGLARSVELARARLQRGEAARPDVTALEGQLLELELDVAEQALARRDARVQLAAAIGEPSRAADWTLDARVDPPPVAADEAAWIAAALRQRPEVQLAAARGRAAEQALGAAGLGAWEGAEAGVAAERDGDWSVGPTLRAPLPLFDAGGPRRALARARLDELAAELDDARRAAVLETRHALLEVQAARHALERVRGELLPLAERRRAELEEVYLAGQSDITPLLLAERELRGAGVRELALARRLAQARARLERAAGGSAALAADPAGDTSTTTEAGAER